MHLHDHRQTVEGESGRAQGVRRRGHRLPHERRPGGSAVGLFGLPRLLQEVPNSWKANQYDNLSNTAAHYEQTGPEIWEQTGGRITHLVVGVGTGGTITGVGRYLKERNPKIKVWGIDTYGSVFKKYKETGIFDKNEIYPYITEDRRGLPAEERGFPIRRSTVKRSPTGMPLS